jgi:hypothetical protein
MNMGFLEATGLAPLPAWPSLFFPLKLRPWPTPYA